MVKAIDVYYWPTPNGHKITIALEEMALPYEIRPVNIGKGEQFTPQFLAISPNNRMPAIVDPEGPDGQPISVFESGAILHHLGRKSGRFYGEDERNRVEVEEWLFWQMAGLGPMAGQAHHFRGYAPTFLPDQRHVAYGARRYTDEVHRLYGVLDRRLAGRDFVAGAYSIADMAAWPWTRSWRAQGIELQEFSNVNAWFARIEGREAVQRALQHQVVARPAAPPTAAEEDERRRNLFERR